MLPFADGADDRTDESSAHVIKNGIDATLIKQAGRQTVALIKKADLTYDARSNTFKGTTANLASTYGLCAGEAFAQQPTAAFCSGTVVEWDPLTGSGLVATAGHCFDDDET